MEPKIRFKGFKGEWKETNLGNISNNFKYGINAAAIPFDGENKYLRITDIDDTTHIFLQENLTSPGADLSNCDEYIMQDGDIVIARTGASVGKSYLYHIVDGKVYFAGFLIRVRTNKDVNKDFVFQKTLTNAYTKHIQFVSQRSGQPGVNVNELKSFGFHIPRDKEEQKAIGKYFTSLDSQISASTSRLASLKQMKAASLQAMFPQEGETVPKVRFKGFEGEWKSLKIGDIAPLQRGYDLPTHSVIKGSIPVVYSNGILRFHNIGKCQAPAIVTGRSGTIGKFTYIDQGEYWPHNTSLWVTSFHDNYPRFVYYLFQNVGFEKYATGSGVPTLNRNDIHKHMISIPSNIEEQKAIGNYFTTLDRQITLQTQRLEKLKQIKSACLDKMFV